MERKQLLVIAVIAILIIAAVGAVVVSGDDESNEYRSTNSDCRLKILGNADENDYLDQADVEKIDDMIAKGEYSRMADANNDGNVDSKDADLVKRIIDVRSANQGKEFSEKEKVTINYVSVDNEILEASYPVGKIIIANTQRALELTIALGVEDRVAAMTMTDLVAYWDDNEYRGCEDIVDIGKRGEPDLEKIAQIDADTIYAGAKNKTLKNVEGETASNKQILRLATWEDGGLESAALTIGFFMDSEKTAQEYVKWMDDINKEIQDIISGIPASDRKSFLVLSSPTAMAVQQDGVSSAIDLTGCRNIGNELVTNPLSSYGKTSDYKEGIIEKDPDIIFFASYIMSQMTVDDIQNKYDVKASTWEEMVGGTNAYKEKNIVMIDYGFPFCLITLVSASILYEDVFSQDYISDKVQEYLDNFTNIPEGFQMDYDHIVHYPM